MIFEDPTNVKLEGTPEKPYDVMTDDELSNATTIKPDVLGDAPTNKAEVPPEAL